MVYESAPSAMRPTPTAAMAVPATLTDAMSPPSSTSRWWVAASESRLLAEASLCEREDLVDQVGQFAGR